MADAPNRLSPTQLKALDDSRKPMRHAMDRLIERHFPDWDDQYAATAVMAMALLCQLRERTGDRNTARLVSVENATSHIVDVDMYDDHYIIRVCYDPIENRIRTVFPKL